MVLIGAATTNQLWQGTASRYSIMVTTVESTRAMASFSESSLLTSKTSGHRTRFSVPVRWGNELWMHVVKHRIYEIGLISRLIMSSRAGSFLALVILILHAYLHHEHYRHGVLICHSSILGMCYRNMSAFTVLSLRMIWRLTAGLSDMPGQRRSFNIGSGWWWCLLSDCVF